VTTGAAVWYGITLKCGFLVLIEWTDWEWICTLWGMKKKKVAVVVPEKAKVKQKKGSVRPYEEAKKRAGVGGYY
jgi:hypothetical protein